MISSSPVWLAFKSDTPAMLKSLRIFALLSILFGLGYLYMLIIAYLLVVGLSAVTGQILIGLLLLFN